MLSRIPLWSGLPAALRHGEDTCGQGSKLTFMNTPSWNDETVLVITPLTCEWGAELSRVNQLSVVLCLRTTTLGTEFLTYEFWEMHMNQSNVVAIKMQTVAMQDVA